MSGWHHPSIIQTTYENCNLIIDHESSSLLYDVHSSLCIVSCYLKELLSSILKEQLTSNFDDAAGPFFNISSLQHTVNRVPKIHNFTNRAMQTSSACKDITSKKTRPKRGQYRKYNSALLVEAVQAVQR